MLALHMTAMHVLKFQNSPKVQFVPQTPTDSWKPSECIPVSSPVSARVSGRYVAIVPSCFCIWNQGFNLIYKRACAQQHGLRDEAHVRRRFFNKTLPD